MQDVCDMVSRLNGLSESHPSDEDGRFQSAREKCKATENANAIIFLLVHLSRSDADPSPSSLYLTSSFCGRGRERGKLTATTCNSRQRAELASKICS